MTSNKTKIFIDGQHGTTGLQIHDRLKDRADIELLELPMADRKDLGKRAEIAKAADIAVLCLPDAAAKELVAALGNADTVVIDASTAHRVADGWTYGFPEMTRAHRQKLKDSNRISNPGCYPTGDTFVPVRPLADRSWLERDRFLRADRLIDTNTMELAVYGNEAEGNVLAVASLDNLGKGASGAAVQCINLKTGVDEATGLAVA